MSSYDFPQNKPGETVQMYGQTDKYHLIFYSAVSRIKCYHVLPFQLEVWLILITSVVIVCAAMIVFTKLSLEIYMDHNSNTRSKLLKLSEICTYSIAAMFQNGNEDNRISPGGGGSQIHWSPAPFEI